MSALAFLLGSPASVAPLASTEEWWERHRAVTEGALYTIDEALLGGFVADRLAYAFASGYQAAIRALVPGLPPDRRAALCVTERSGTHPRSLEARLSAIEGGFRLRGSKRWSMVSDESGVLLVAAIDGAQDERGRNRVRLVRVDAGAPGVHFAPMPETSFIPEISHSEVRLDDVWIAADALLPGDGYERYVKPFRTVEDLHVHAALFGYLVGEARRHAFPRELLERMAALIAALRGLGLGDPSAPWLHVALGGVLRLAAGLLDEIEVIWARTESPAAARWERDRLLLSVASGARGKRLARAWEALSSGGYSGS